MNRVDKATRLRYEDFFLISPLRKVMLISNCLNGQFLDSTMVSTILIIVGLTLSWMFLYSPSLLFVKILLLLALSYVLLEFYHVLILYDTPIYSLWFFHVRRTIIQVLFLIRALYSICIASIDLGDLSACLMILGSYRIIVEVKILGFEKPLLAYVVIR